MSSTVVIAVQRIAVHFIPAVKKLLTSRYSVLHLTTCTSLHCTQIHFKPDKFFKIDMRT